MQRQVGYSEQYEEALRVATVAHRRQTRKGSGLPYIIHPFHVSVILMRHGFSKHAVIAGLLHDVVEDQGLSIVQIEELSGVRVAEIVEAMSERKKDSEGVRRPWDVRKREALDQIRAASDDAVAVKAADTVHNARSFVQDLRQEGVEIWQHFNRGPRAQLDYYCEIRGIVEDRLGAHPLVAELADAVEALAGVIGETPIG
ncbi:MAG: HD domain-containing protein [Anaerolineae bacterium]|jgi:(p)ppGpp synthase/HD superfamily hydrolase